jgi:hypothetical protein
MVNDTRTIYGERAVMPEEAAFITTLGILACVATGPTA